jgi:hypothetical protein
MKLSFSSLSSFWYGKQGLSKKKHKRKLAVFSPVGESLFEECCIQS